MAFAYTVNDEINMKNLKIVTGTWTVTSSTKTGEIDTGMSSVDYAFATTYDSSVIADPAVFNETFPFINGEITLITTSGTTGGWKATGH